MYPRLYIAKQLLKDDGVIFISIDDNEVAQLRLLMDEVFGEENFINEFIWKNGRTSSAIFTNEQEYILAYGKKTEKISFITYNEDDKIITERAIKKIGTKNPASKILFPKGIRFEGDDKVFPKEFGESEIVKVVKGELICKDNKLAEDVELEAGWVMKDMIEDWIAGNDVIDSKGQKVSEFFFKANGVLQYVKEKGTTHPKTIIEGFSTKLGTNEIVNLFKKPIFEFPKPTKLINFLLLIVNKNDIILDFFAGSGTTGDAVMQLNAEDGGNRKFILVQIPEEIDSKKNKAAYDFVKDELKADPTIFEITKERLLRAVKKINADLDEKIAKLKGELPTQENKAEIEKLERCKTQNSFKIFETTPIWEDYDFEAEQFDSSQTLFDIGELTEDDIKALLITWKTYDGIALTQELESVDLGGYTAYYGNGRLYLMNKGFTTDTLKALLEKIDNDKHFEPKSIIAFGYRFESARLMELSENIKTYNNKKKSDIDFITRY